MRLRALKSLLLAAALLDASTTAGAGLRKSVIGNGGAPMAGGSWAIKGTLGQGSVGRSYGGRNHLGSGYWASGFGAPYTLSRFDGIYTPLPAESQSPNYSLGGDDEYAPIPMPFSFAFFGVRMPPWLAISMNGYAFFTSCGPFCNGTSSGNNSTLFNRTLPYPIIAPWFGDLRSGSVRYQTQGSPGSRTLTVEWSGAQFVGDEEHELFDVQLTLYETTNVIEFRYRASLNGYPVVPPTQRASIGISIGTGSVPFIDAITGSQSTSTGRMNLNFWRTQRFIRFTPVAPTPLAGGTYTVGAGQTYPSLSEAIADVNHRGISGPVTLSLTDAVYDSTKNVFPLILGPVSGASATNTLTIQPAVGTATLVHRGDGPYGFIGDADGQFYAGFDPLFVVMGADDLTLRNLTLTTGGGVTAHEGLMVRNSSRTDGAQNDTFRDLTISMHSDSLTSAIVQANSGASTSAGANSNNHYHNLTLSNVDTGVLLLGNSTYPDENCEVGVTEGGTTTIGGSSAGSLGAYGIVAYNQRAAKIFQCEVRSAAGLGSGGLAEGIVLDNSGLAPGTSGGVSEISRNRVHDLVSATGVVTGISASVNNNAGTEARVFNNIVYGLDSGSSVTSSRSIIGIAAQRGGTASSGALTVAFNSVRLQPAAVLPACSNTDFELGTGGVAHVNVYDNIFSNYTPGQVGAAKHYAWSAPTLSLGPIGTGLSGTDYNVLHVENPNGFTGLSAGPLPDHLTLANWRSTIFGEEHSASGDPVFASASDLHLSNSGSPASNAGIALAYTTIDFDGDARSSTPDIGADEVAGTVATNEGEIANALALSPIAPNPAVGATDVVFTLPSAMPASVTVYDAAGKRVAVLANGKFPAGRHAVRWGGGTEHKIPASGLYFVRLETELQSITQRLVRMR